MFIHRLSIHKDVLSLDQWLSMNRRGDIGHKIIWKAFGDRADRERDFIFRLEQHPDMLLFYVVCSRHPDDWEGRFEIDTKPYHPVLKRGQLLQFQVRANPSVAVKTPGSSKRGRRQDAIAHAKNSDPERFEQMSQNDIVQFVGVQWLKKRLVAHGIQLLSEHTQISQYKTTRFQKKNNASPVSFSVMDAQGLCLVEQPDDALALLYNGLGRQKSHGMGMFMVKSV